jgi:uncharacterized membrane protein (UPF0127 family)
MKVINATKKKEIARNVIVADSALKRMKGLLGKRKIEEGESIWIKPCKGVHTVGMRFPIDVIFLDKSNVVMAIRKNLLPNRITRLYLGAAGVIELSAGGLSATNTEVGDVIQIV